MKIQAYRERVFYGVITGFIFGLLLCLLVGINYLLGGAVRRQYDSVWNVVVTYLGGGTAVGALVGALQPLARSRKSALLIGPVAIFPLVFLIAPSVLGSISAWGRYEWVVVALTSVGFGGGVGFALYPKIVDEYRGVFEEKATEDLRKK